MSLAVESAATAFLDGTPKQLWIGGGWVDPSSGQWLDSVNPSTGEVIASVAAGTAADVDRAVAAAREAFEGPWRRFTPAARTSVLTALADLVEHHYAELNLLDVLEMGRPVGRPVDAAATLPVRALRFYASAAQMIHGSTLPNSVPNRFTYSLREPVGVVGAITPWNGPLLATVLKLGPALATGCTVVLKPAEDSSLSALRLAELMQELDLPQGVVNVVTGLGSVAGAALAAHPGVDKIAFTGSTETGRAIVRASAGNLKRVSLELGGKSPDIVFADADLELAAKGAAMGIFGNAGQVCVAGSRLFAERSVADELTDRVARIAGSLRVGISTDPSTQIGPLVSARQLDRVSSYVAAGEREGAALAAGGRRLTGAEHESGYFLAPTVFTGVTDDMVIAREEIFGPVVSVFAFDSVDEVIERANRTEYGLAAGVWTTNLAKAHRVAAALQAGTVWVNTYGEFDPAVPFGGYKTSGWGREFGLESLEGYLNTKSVWVATN